jgi:hypothetical protein
MSARKWEVVKTTVLPFGTVLDQVIWVKGLSSISPSLPGVEIAARSFLRSLQPVSLTPQEVSHSPFRLLSYEAAVLCLYPSARIVEAE